MGRLREDEVTPPEPQLNLRPSLESPWWREVDADWAFAPAEYPAFPGAPSTPVHSLGLRWAYGLISVIVGVTGGLGNALVVANQPQLQGALALYAQEMAWLPTAFVVGNMSMNLLLIKFRQQFGLQQFTLGFVSLYAVIALLHVFAHSFSSALALRAVSGTAAAGLSSLSIFYMVQAASAKWRLSAIAIGICLPQLSTPLARLLPLDLLYNDDWQALSLLECGLTLVSLAAVLCLKLPPAKRTAAYEPLDFVSFALLTGGLALFIAAVGQGRLLWWTDTPWLGVALCASIPPLVLAMLIERYRRAPLVATSFLASSDILRFIVLGLIVRLVLTEQTYAAVGLLNSLGFMNDQFHGLFLIVTAANIAGLLIGARILNPQRLLQQILVSLILIAAGSWLDSDATNLTRAPMLYLSQGLLAFAATFSLGPSLIFGIVRTTKRPPNEYITFFALFGIILNVGSFLGTAVLGTFQVWREKAHFSAIIEHLAATDPQVAERVRDAAAVYRAVTIDPAVRAAQGAWLLERRVTLESNVLAYDDVFQLTTTLAALACLWIAIILLRRSLSQKT